MYTSTNDDFKTHFDQFLAERKEETLSMLLDGRMTLDEELNDMKTATSTLVNDYTTIHAGSDPVDKSVLTQTAIACMRTYFAELTAIMDSKTPTGA